MDADHARDVACILRIVVCICRQIQEILVSLGDKESSFVGSSQWIGAIELSYILDEYLGITSKVRDRRLVVWHMLWSVCCTMPQTNTIACDSISTYSTAQLMYLTHAETMRTLATRL